MPRFAILVLSALVGTGLSAAASAEPVMVQCGREYQAAKAAGTLNGMDWSRYRVDCAARLKDGAPAVSAAAPAAAPPPAAPTAPAAAAPARVASPSGGMSAMHGRQKQCGAEWRAQKASLVAQTPGLTWPRYWSQCNARLKAAGQ
jgi:hypothetical protein